MVDNWGGGTQWYMIIITINKVLNLIKFKISNHLVKRCTRLENSELTNWLVLNCNRNDHQNEEFCHIYVEEIKEVTEKHWNNSKNIYIIN